MALGKQTADRVERFLDAHPDGRLVVCVGSASVAGIVWLAERTRRTPVTLLIGDLKSRNFAKATDADRRAALNFVDRRAARERGADGPCRRLRARLPAQHPPRPPRQVVGRQGAPPGMDRARRRPRAPTSSARPPIRPDAGGRQATTACSRSIHWLRITGPSSSVPGRGRSRSNHPLRSPFAGIRVTLHN